MNLIRHLAIIALVLNASSQPLRSAVPESARSREVIARVTPQLAKALRSLGFRFGDPVFMRVFKESKELEVWVKNGRTFKLFRKYPIHYFSGNLGPKLKEGDRQEPEGFYYVSPTRMNPHSRFHLSFNLGYPNKYDRIRERTGSALMVHGSTVSIGCFAMTDQRIEEIYTLSHGALSSGQKFFRVHIFPFRMTAAAMKEHIDPKWRNFWMNLKEGYDLFEKTRLPPNVEVENKRYVFDIRTTD